MQRIVIADPNELLSLRMSGLVSRADGFDVVGTAPDCSTALELVRRTHPDVVLVDLFMPPLGGVALIAAINYAVPGTRVFVLVGEAREATLQAAYAAGALGFVTKDGSVQHVPPDLGWSGAGPARVARVSTLQAAAGAASVNDDRFTTAGA